MDMEMNGQLETKAGIPHGRGGDAWRTDARLRGLQGDQRRAPRRGRAARRPTSLTEEKLARINHALDEHQRVIDELDAEGRAADARPRRRARSRALRSASTRRRSTPMCARAKPRGLRALEVKALSVGTDPDGGYLVPDETGARDRPRGSRPSRRSARIAGVRQISGNVYKKPFMTTGPAAGWVGETAARTADQLADARRRCPSRRWSSTPCRRRPQRCSTTPPSTSTSGSPRRSSSAFAEQEGTAFVTGDGTNKPKGFLAYTKVANASWELGQDRLHRDRRRPAPFPASDPSDMLVDLSMRSRPATAQNGIFVMNRKTQARDPQVQGHRRRLSLAAAGDGRRPRLADGLPGVEAEDMPDMAANSYSVAFGDFRRGYLIVDRAGIRVLRDPYSAKPYVLFYTTKRVGGGVQDFDAIKLLKFAAS